MDKTRWTSDCIFTAAFQSGTWLLVFVMQLYRQCGTYYAQLAPIYHRYIQQIIFSDTRVLSTYTPPPLSSLTLPMLLSLLCWWLVQAPRKGTWEPLPKHSDSLSQGTVLFPLLGKKGHGGMPSKVFTLIKVLHNFILEIHLDIDAYLKTKKAPNTYLLLFPAFVKVLQQTRLMLLPWKLQKST